MLSSSGPSQAPWEVTSRPRRSVTCCPSAPPTSASTSRSSRRRWGLILHRCSVAFSSRVALVGNMNPAEPASTPAVPPSGPERKRKLITVIDQAEEERSESSPTLSETHNEMAYGGVPQEHGDCCADHLTSLSASAAHGLCRLRTVRPEAVVV